MQGCWVSCSEERAAGVQHAPSRALGFLEGQLGGARGICRSPLSNRKDPLLKSRKELGLSSFSTLTESMPCAYRPIYNGEHAFLSIFSFKYHRLGIGRGICIFSNDTP